MASTAVLVSVRWGDDLLALRRISGDSEATFGGGDDALLPIPAESLGAERFTFARISGGGAKIHVPAGAIAVHHLADGFVRAVAGPAELTLDRGDRAVLPRGGFELCAEAIDPRGPSLRTPIWSRIGSGAGLHIAAAALAHAALFFTAGHSALASESIDASRLQGFKSLLAAAERRASGESPVHSDGSDFGDGRQENAAPGNGDPGGGERAAAEEGAAGSALSRSAATRRYAVSHVVEARPSAGPKAPIESFESAMLGLLHASPSGIATTSPWAASGERDIAANGAMWARSIGESTGGEGLGLSGTGLGGGGSGRGVGLGKIGSLGHSDGPPGMGTGGEGSLRFRARISVHTYRPYSCGLYGCSVSGRLPPEAVQRIVRANMGRMRGCYEAGLRRNPSLAGRVASKFLIGRDGSVSSVENAGSDLPDPGVVACIVRSFYGLSFPQPEGGVVTVVYPIVFSTDR